MSQPAPDVIDLLGYRIHVGPWLLEQAGRIAAEVAPAHVYAVITDEHVGPVAAPQVVGSLRHYAPHARVILQGVTPGEATKTRATWQALTDWLLGERCGRDTTVIALGGGVVGDLAGFVAATFMRGIPVVQVPTTLLAMVDASVGGKVGVDTEHGKNLVGAFHQPAAVVIDPTVLQTLPPAEFRAGMAEVIKHGVIADVGYFDRSIAAARAILGVPAAEVDWTAHTLTRLVSDSVRIKASIVAQDPREAPGGIRQSLNFGHTIGHAVEGLMDFRVPHGHAVSIGMVLESALGETLGVTAAGTTEIIRDRVRSLDLPVDLPSGLSVDEVAGACRRDKKARGAKAVFSLPARVGAMAVSAHGHGVSVESAAIISALSRA
ncbi:MAG: 3-dehydroquinate synthase [Gemmatimonadetes bacterium]|nr:3-dehydroquinate synthase [Gemmatimonadota bacterium]